MLLILYDKVSLLASEVGMHTHVGGISVIMSLYVCHQFRLLWIATVQLQAAALIILVLSTFKMFISFFCIAAHNIERICT